MPLPRGRLIPLAGFFETTYVPLRLRNRTAGTIDNYVTAIGWLRKAIQQEPLVADLARPNLEAMLRLMVASKVGWLCAQHARKHLMMLWKSAWKLGMVDAYDPPPLPRPSAFDPAKPRTLNPAFVARIGKPPHNKLPPEPPAPAGSLRELYENGYQLERLTVHPRSHQDYARTLRGFRRFLEREPLLTDLTDKTVSAWFAALLADGTAPGTVNNERARLFALWRFAIDKDLFDGKPPRVKKLKVASNAPDAWTVPEVRRLIAATDQLSGLTDVLPARLYWRAILLVCWWTAQRRSTLHRLRHSDVDLERGVLSVPGTTIKNMHGRRFRIGPDAVEALRAIWAPDRDRLFPTAENEHVTFRRLLKSAGLAESDHRLGQFHKLRRSVATAVCNTAGLHASMALLDHSGPEVHRRYLDPTQIQAQDVTKILPTL